MGELSDKVRAALARDPKAHAIQFKGAWHSWGDVARIVASLDDEFARLGLGPGAAVGCVFRNRPAFAAAIMGIISGERCLVTLNGHLPDARLAADIIAARPPVVIALAEDWSRPELRNAVAEIGAAGLSLSDEGAARVAGLERVGAGPHVEPPAGTAVLMLTSGTTGAPKRVPLTMATLERQLVESSGGAARHGVAEPAAPNTDVAILGASFVHISGVWGLMGPAMAGRPVVLLEKFNVPEWHAAVVEHRPRAAGAPPTALRMILDANLPAEDLSSLAALGSGTAPLDPDINDAFLSRYNIAVLANYGATEFAGAIASWSLASYRQFWSAKRGAVGRVHNTMDARVVDPETDEVLAPGREGILELKGFVTGRGDAWLRTTDLAVMDEDRFLWIKGRADNAIVRGGFKIQPDDVVAVLQQHPAVAEASVVGVPDRRLGEVPVAALVLKPGVERPTDAELEALVRSRLMAYCAPTAFRVVDELPRTPSLKVSMPAVRAMFEESPAEPPKTA